MFCRRNLLFLLFSLLAATGVQAQVGQSPYTVKGIGNINSMATASNQGMGGVGIGYTSPFFVTVQNPALLSSNAFYTSALAGFSLESRRIATAQEQDRTSSGGFDYLAVAFPLLKNKIGFTVGLSPYSTVSYQLNSLQPIEGMPDQRALVLFEGSGGLTQAYAATGFKIYKGLSAGARVSYLFGNITEEVATTVAVDPSQGVSYTAHYIDKSNFSDVLLSTGLSYRYDFPKEEGSKEPATFFVAGLTYDLETNLSADRSFVNERVNRVGDRPFFVDTLFVGNGSVRLPSALGFGVSYGKNYTYTIGADVRLQDWGRYKSFENSEEDGLGSSYRVAVGGEWIPDFFSRNYFKRMTYRTGVVVEKTPFIVNSEKINEFGINFGLTFPVGVSGVHTSFMLGQRGTTNNDLIRERFFRITLGVSLNERWFERYKYD